MKYLVVGSGAREHAISYKLAQSKEVEKVFVWPGNDGIAFEKKCFCLKDEKNIKNEKDLIEFAQQNNIDTVVVGPENYLANGIVDRFEQIGIPSFGPNKRSSILEASKSFAKKLMQKYDIATAEYYETDSYNNAIEHIKFKNKYPIVIKADGLAAGKGVFIAYDFEQAENFCKLTLAKKIFGYSSNKVVIEKYLKGFEASIIALSDGKNLLPLISAKDHKQAFDGNKGPNTGGMGVVAPNPFLKDEDYEKFVSNILNPTLDALRQENLIYKGALFFGLMITNDGPFLLEYNVRFGDPETQAILYSLETDFNLVVQEVLNGNLNKVNLCWKNGYTCAVVLASKGYPNSFEKGFEIKGLNDVESKIFYSAVKNIDGKIVTDGGRVLTVVNNAQNLELARDKVYKDVSKLSFDNITFRKDIGISK